MSVSLAQLPDIHFETITSKDGLPSNTIFTATKDKEGFMWFGTRLCPVRYDGTTFQSFRNPKTNLVTGIAIDKNNTVWLSSDKSGICKIEAHSLKMNAIEKNIIGSTGDFYIDRQGNGWYSDFSGANKLNLSTGQVVHYPFQTTPFLWNKASFIEDHANTLWVIGRDNGLFRYDAKNDTLICVLGKDSTDPAKKDSILFSKGCVDHQGILWIGSYNRGLIRYNPDSNEFIAIETNRVNNQITTVMEGQDENGNRILWVGDDQGLGVFRPEQKKFYFFTDIFPQRFEVNNLFRDSDQGIVWACTTEGIVKYHPKSNMIKAIKIPDYVLSTPASVTVFLQDKLDDNTYYLGLSNTGIVKWNSVSNQFKLIPFPAPPTETRWMAQRSDGTIWIGTNRWDYTRPGIFIYDPKKNAFVTSELLKLANSYFSVPFFMYGVFDKKDRLWLGNSDEGIHVLDEISNIEVTPWQDSTQRNFLKNNNLLNGICIDRYDRVLLCAYDGIFYVDQQNGRFVLLDPAEITSNYPAANSLLIDADENVWAARWGGLTYSSPNGKIKRTITTDDGFYDHENRGLAYDYQGNIWIGNYEGIYCFMRATQRLVRFTSNDGLMNNNTTHGIISSRDGKQIFVAQKNGFNIIKADQLLAAQNPSVLAVGSFKIRGNAYEADLSKPVYLKRSDNAFSVDFIALNYRKHQDNQYAYFLEGFEDDWNYSGAEHQAYYTNLNPDSYTLHIKTSDAFGNWNSKELLLQIHVLPAFYETWWFKIALLLLILAILYGLYRYRINQLLNMQRVRNRISADLHDELGSSLSGISIMGTLAQKTMTEQHPSTPFISRIIEDVQQISGSLDDIVWNISPKNDGLKSVIARMTRYSSELFEAKQIKYQFTLPENIDRIRLSMEQRRNFYLIFKESVNNLVKYSQCLQASINIEVINQNLLFTIQDDGVGFDVDMQSERNGLRNIRERVKALRGELQLESRPGKTFLQLEFPMNE
ncbi:MAG: two-component regulator propeller domain-containing protein [Chryseolinea sp.]